MKRIFTLVTAAIMTLSLFAGCSAENNTPQDTTTKNGSNSGTVTSIMDVLGDDMLAIYENRNTKLPAAVVYIFQGNGVRVESSHHHAYRHFCDERLREYSLTLYDDIVYIYEYPKPLGIWSFYTDGAEYFIEALEGAK